MFKHRPIIIPEINSQSAICDYLLQTSLILSAKVIPTYVFFVNFPRKIYQKPFDQINPHLIHSYPIQIIPFNRFELIQQLNILLSFNLLYLLVLIRHHHRPRYWFFYPQLINLIRFSPPPRAINYDIVDSYNCPDSQKQFLLQHASTITAISRNLISQYQSLWPAAHIHLVPQGFNLLKSPAQFPPLKNLNKLTNRIGFIGVLSNRLDYQLLFSVIKNNPKYNFIFVGPTGTDINVSPKPVEKLNRQLLSFKNVHYLGPAPKDQIESVIKFFDIAIIPYDIQDQFNRLCYPMKIFEYFACQKPVVSTLIEELKQFPDLIKIGNTPTEWQKHLESLMSRPLPSSLKTKANKLSQDNSWEHKVDQILNLISA